MRTWNTIKTKPHGLSGLVTILVLLVLAGCQSSQPVQLQQQDQGNVCHLEGSVFSSSALQSQSFSAGTWLVGIERSELTQLLEDLGAELESYDEQLAVAHIRLGTASTTVLPQSVRFFESATVQRQRYNSFQGDLSALEWARSSLNLPEGLSGQGITIAVVDDGIEATHQEFRGRVVTGYDAFSRQEITPGSDQANQENFHGTHVAGLALAAADGVGITGIAPEAALMPIRIFNGFSYAGDLAAARAIVWAVDNGADIINNSWGGTSYSSLLYEAVSYAMKRGVLVVTASGNSGIENFSYPGSYPNVIRVGASTPQQERASFSSFGSSMTIVAPGLEIVSTFPEQSYALLSGTSMSTPIVAGVLALALEVRPDWTAYQVQEALAQSALDMAAPGWDEETGFGLINPAGMVLQNPGLGANLYLKGLPADAALHLSQGQQVFYVNANSSGEVAFHLLAPEQYQLRIVTDVGHTEGTVNLSVGDNHCDF